MVVATGKLLGEVTGMLPAAVLGRFVEQCPAAVMVRATLERLLRPERLGQIVADARQRQYHKRMLFLQLVAVMSAVATRRQQSVHAAYLAAQEQWPSVLF